ncbi:MAG: prepilin-type N-terminal cleavage/methylation domain-containing protein [Phycisphaerales bacterium JB041]
MSVVRRRGMTIVEVLVAMVLLSMMLGGVLSAVELSARTQHSTADVAMARSLAADLLEEACGKPYVDPADPNETGLGADENASDRSTFDDVDDYHGWMQKPPLFADGSAIPGAAAWQRRVFVRLVDPSDPNVILGTESGGKLVIVRVTRGPVIYAEMSRLRTQSWDRFTE